MVVVDTDLRVHLQNKLSVWQVQIIAPCKLHQVAVLCKKSVYALHQGLDGTDLDSTPKVLDRHEKIPFAVNHEGVGAFCKEQKLGVLFTSYRRVTLDIVLDHGDIITKGCS